MAAQVDGEIAHQVAGVGEVAELVESVGEIERLLRFSQSNAHQALQVGTQLPVQALVRIRPGP